MVPENNGIVRLSSNEVGINSIIIADKAPKIIIISALRLEQTKDW